MEIKSLEDIAQYNAKNAHEVAGMIIDHFHKTSSELDKLDLPEDLTAQLGHAQVGSYLKACGNSFAGFVSLLIDNADEATYTSMREQFVNMIGNLMDESRKLAKETKDANDT